MVSSRLEMRGISLAFSGFQALSRVDFTLSGGSGGAPARAPAAGETTPVAGPGGEPDAH